MSVRMKMCGLMRREDATAVNIARPDFAGFILSGGFRRSISKETAWAIRAELSLDIKTVGVFVNEPLENVLELAQAGVMDMVQLHGSENAEYIASVREQTGLPVVKVFIVREAADVAAANESIADLVLLDSGTGTGKAFDWNLLEAIGRPYVLAGGLNAENVCEALEAANKVGRLPYAVDTSSGIETEGCKDPERMMEFANAVRSFDKGEEHS